MHEFLRKRMDRYRSFYGEPEPGMLLLQICPYTFDVGSAPGVEPFCCTTNDDSFCRLTVASIHLLIYTIG